MLPDTHIHTAFSGDCSTPAAIQIERCISMGMQEVCITDHHDYDTGMKEEIFLLDFPAYLSRLHSLREEYKGRIRISIGVELGLQSHIRDYLDTLTHSLDVDYIIGSCHFIDRMDPYYPSFFEGRSERSAYERYFEVALRRIQDLDCFDSFGHLDYVVRYGPNKNRDYHYQDYKDVIDSILETLIRKGKALECNTGGFHYGLGHPNPCEEILCRYRELGGELLTVGSDAHTPEYVGFDFKRTKELLKACGFSHYTVYHQRKPQFLPL